MDLERGIGGLASMEELLSIPFDELQRRSEGAYNHVEDPVWEVRSRRQPPDISYEALRVLGGSHQLAAAAGIEGGNYQELVQLDEGRIRRGVKPRVLQSIPERVIPKDTGLQCHICMEGFDGVKKAKRLPCKHVFCKSCISKWLADHDTCPTCRWKFPEDQTQLEFGYPRRQF